MREDQAGDRVPASSAFWATLALLVTALACSIVVIHAPRPVVPGELPPLRLDAALVERQTAQQRALVARAQRLRNDLEVQELTAAVLEEGLIELEPKVDFELVRKQRVARGELARKVFARLGPELSRGYLLTLLEEAMSALYSADAHARETDRARGLLGTFPKLLAQYGYARNGRLVAPPSSVRSFYRARLNLIFERPVTSDFSPIELQAYEGFHALSAGGLPAELRAHAAAAFHGAGGRDGAEALGIWMFQGGQHADALTMLRKAETQSHPLAVRNMMLVVSQALAL